MANYKTKWMSVTKSNSLSSEQLKQVEEKLGCHFPIGFKSYAMLYHGQMSTACNKITFKNDEGQVIKTSITWLHSFDVENEYESYIVDLNQKLTIADKPDNLISFAADGAGGYICFDISHSEEYPVVIWFNGYTNYTYFALAPNFDEFMSNLECD